MKSHDELVVAQFGRQASEYVRSAVHAQGPDLAALTRNVARLNAATLLDIGCGGGHASFAAARHVGEVIAYDLSTDMLDAVRSSAAERGLDNIVTACGAAEALPLADASFDVVVSRYSAHHWRDLAAGLTEARRVLKPGGSAFFIDAVAPERASFDTFLQTVELLRDPSHVRDYTPSQWETHLERAGFRTDRTTLWRVRLEFGPWIARMATPPVRAEAIRSLHDVATSEVRDYFEVAANGDFTIDTLDVCVSPR